jgi:hypothetical protein
MARSIPEPIILALREQFFPKLLAGEMEGDDVYLLMADKKGRPDHAVHYIASDDFKTAVRVADSGAGNLLMLCERGGFRVTLVPPPE